MCRRFIGRKDCTLSLADVTGPRDASPRFISPAPCHLVSSSYRIVHDHRRRDQAPRETSLENVRVHDVGADDNSFFFLKIFGRISSGMEVNLKKDRNLLLGRTGLGFMVIEVFHHGAMLECTRGQF